MSRTNWLHLPCFCLSRMSSSSFVVEFICSLLTPLTLKAVLNKCDLDCIVHLIKSYPHVKVNFVIDPY